MGRNMTVFVGESLKLNLLKLWARVLKEGPVCSMTILNGHRKTKLERTTSETEHLKFLPLIRIVVNSATSPVSIVTDTQESYQLVHNHARISFLFMAREVFLLI